jgi:hypothetical protein
MHGLECNCIEKIKKWYEEGILNQNMGILCISLTEKQFSMFALMAVSSKLIRAQAHPMHLIRNKYVKAYISV